MCLLTTGSLWFTHVLMSFVQSTIYSLSYIVYYMTVFLNRWAAARYRALASIIPGRERLFWKLSF